MEELFKIYKRLLAIHIATKCAPEAEPFHRKTEDAYNTLFSVFHTISEMRQDIEEDEPELVSDVAIEAYDLVEQAKGIVEKMVKSNKDLGMDNLLRWHYETLNGVCGNLRGFINDKD